MGLGLLWGLGEHLCPGKRMEPAREKEQPGTSRACEDSSEAAQCLLPRSVVGQGGKGTGKLREIQINRWEITEGKIR